MAVEGDITPDQFKDAIGDDVTVVANGGTTGQIVPVLMCCRDKNPHWFNVINLQPDFTSVLYAKQR